MSVREQVPSSCHFKVCPAFYFPLGPYTHVSSLRAIQNCVHCSYPLWPLMLMSVASARNMVGATITMISDQESHWPSLLTCPQDDFFHQCCWVHPYCSKFSASLWFQQGSCLASWPAPSWQNLCTKQAEREVEVWNGTGTNTTVPLSYRKFSGFLNINACRVVVRLKLLSRGLEGSFCQFCPTCSCSLGRIFADVLTCPLPKVWIWGYNFRTRLTVLKHMLLILYHVVSVMLV